MKNAYIILAHKNPKQVKSLVDSLEKDAVFIFHICKNASNETFQEFNSELYQSNHHFCERVRSFWGEIGLVQATINALKYLSELEENYDRVHLLSGQDLPIKNEKERQDFLEKVPNKEFIRHWKFYPIDPENLAENDWASSKHYQQKRLFHYYIRHNNEKYVIPKKYDTRLKEMSALKATLHFLKRVPRYIMQKKLKYKWNEFRFTRKLPYPKPLPKIQFWGGSHWFSITPRAVDYLLEFDRKDTYLKKFYEQVLLPDESYFQTVLLNSPFAKDIVNANLREIIFESTSPNPVFLEEKHFETIKASDALFARKFDDVLSAKIIEKVRTELL